MKARFFQKLCGSGVIACSPFSKSIFRSMRELPVRPIGAFIVPSKG